MRQTCSVLPVCWWSIFPRHKENNFSCGLGSWAGLPALPGLGGSNICIMALRAQAIMWPYTGVTSSVSIRLLSPSLSLAGN